MKKSFNDLAMEHTPKKAASSPFVAAMQTKDTFTDNGAVTHSTTQNNCLDFFFLAGASRRMTDKDIEAMFSKAYGENKRMAMKILFWARDIREGAGERRLFRVCLDYLKAKSDGTLGKITSFIPEFGRWDDIFHGALGEATKAISLALEAKDALCAKWMPREKSSKSALAKAIAKELGFSSKEYRKTIANLSSTVEQAISKNEWSNIEYSKLPSIAFKKYRNAFAKHDEARFTAFTEKAVAEPSSTTINAGAIFPHDIIAGAGNATDRNSVIAQWNNLPDYCNDELILPIVDVSGSMFWGTEKPKAGDVAVALGIYLSERNKGPFKDTFLSFSSSSQFNVLNGDIIDRLNQMTRAHWDGGTNIQAAFQNILTMALDNNVKNEDMPTKILILSDMEFDHCGTQTNCESIEEMYTNAGYKLPQIVFWNLQGKPGNTPVNRNDKNVALVSGFSPAIMKSILGGEDFTPMGIMLKTIDKERYAFINKLV